MNKKTSIAFGKKVFLLGTDREGTAYFLEESMFDCGWYWGIGYVKTYTNNLHPNQSTDIDSHQHFDSMFLHGRLNAFDAFNDFFADTVLTEQETWKFIELMKTLYVLSQYSDVIYRGGANYTENLCRDVIKNDAEYDRINKIVIPAVLAQIYKLLSQTEVYHD